MTETADRARCWILCLGVGVFVPLGLLAKQSMATVFIATAVLLLISTAIARPRDLLPPRALLLSFAAFAVFATATHLFAIDCQTCGERAVQKLPMLALVLWTAACAAGALDGIGRRRVALALCIGLGIGLVLALIELSADAVIYRTLSDRHGDPDVPLFRYNRGTTALVLLAWPAAAWLWSENRRAGTVALIALSLVVAGYGHSASALVAGLIALAVSVLGMLAPALTQTIGFAATAAFSLASPFIFLHLLDWIAPAAKTIPPSVLDRIEIWHHSAVGVFESPLFGHGLGAIRERAIIPELAERYTYLTKPPTHPHDAAIQLWLETGTIGVAVFLTIAWFAARPIRNLAQPWRAAALAASAGVVFTALVSYGLWQETWLAIIAMTALAFRALAPGKGSS